MTNALQGRVPRKPPPPPPPPPPFSILPAVLIRETGALWERGQGTPPKPGWGDGTIQEYISMGSVRVGWNALHT